MLNKNEVLKSFHILTNYLGESGVVRNMERYKKDFSAFLLHAQHLKTYDFIAPYCRDKKVLDIGCFIGYGEKYIASYARELIAIDSNDMALKFAMQNNFAPNVKFQKVDARNLPFSKEDFDTVIASHLIEHIPVEEVINFLHEVKRVLKNGGLFFIATPNRKFRLLPFQRPFNPQHYQEFTAKGLSKVLKTTFQVQIKGIRAKQRVEEIERKRVRKSPFRTYIYYPFYRRSTDFLNTILPMKLKVGLKKIKSKMIESFQSEDEQLSDNGRFNNLFQKFSMDDFYLESQMLNKSITLFTICKK
jgi:SAM-dependent methyltransferase